MAIINFPSNPQTNDQYVFEGQTWFFNGVGWSKVTNQYTVLPEQNNNANKYLFTNGTQASWSEANASQLQGRAVLNTAPSDGQVLTWVSANNRWEPKALPSGAVETGVFNYISARSDAWLYLNFSSNTDKDAFLAVFSTAEESTPNFCSVLLDGYDYWTNSSILLSIKLHKTNYTFVDGGATYKELRWTSSNFLDFSSTPSNKGVGEGVWQI